MSIAAMSSASWRYETPALGTHMIVEARPNGTIIIDKQGDKITLSTEDLNEIHWLLDAIGQALELSCRQPLHLTMSQAA